MFEHISIVPQLDANAIEVYTCMNYEKVIQKNYCCFLTINFLFIYFNYFYCYNELYKRNKNCIRYEICNMLNVCHLNSSKKTEKDN